MKYAGSTIPAPAVYGASVAAIAAACLGVGHLLSDGRLPLTPRHMAGVVVGAGVVGSIAEPLSQYIRQRLPGNGEPTAEQTIEAIAALLDDHKALPPAVDVPCAEPVAPPVSNAEPQGQGLQLVYEASNGDDLPSDLFGDDDDEPEDYWGNAPAATPAAGPSARVLEMLNRAKRA